ncbi:MAG: hypothetical protein ACLUPW_08330 [Bifidobacterium pseudocatenulatum]
MISDLLLLIKAQKPILPTTDNRINVMDPVQVVVQLASSRWRRNAISPSILKR